MRSIAVRLVVAYALLGAGGVIYVSLGRSILSDAYRGESWSAFNEVISGQDTHPESYYRCMTDQLAGRAFGVGLFAVTMLGGFALLNRAYGDGRLSRRSATTLALIGFTVLLSPPVFARLFAVAGFVGHDAAWLWVFTFGLAAAIGVTHRLEGASRRRALALLTSIVVLVGVEMSVRIVMNFSPSWRADMTRLADGTYPDHMRYRSHPFLQYTGTPRSEYDHHDHCLPSPRQSRYNSLGFVGPEFRYAKPDGLTRIACLGGSTTESGYPAFLEAYLSDPSDDIGEVEVLNFGLSAYNSGNSLVNFVLNVRDFAPEVVVIHHGWNDGEQTPIGPSRPGDYSHSHKAFSPPRRSDRFLVRASVVYRWVRSAVVRTPSDAVLTGAITHDEPLKRSLGGDEVASHGMTPLERNVRTIIDLTLLDGALPVIATIPVSTDPDIIGAEGLAWVEANNERLRVLAREYGDRVLFVDLAETLSGENSLYRDLAHMTDKGRRRKAERIGLAIAERLR